MNSNKMMDVRSSEVGIRVKFEISSRPVQKPNQIKRLKFGNCSSELSEGGVGLSWLKVNIKSE